MLRQRSYLVEDVLRKKKTGLQKFIEKHGIKPQKRHSSHYNASFGYSEKEKKFYGWSHRAIHGFGVGHTVKKGHMPHKYRGKTAKTLDDAKKFAIAFAKDVN